MKFANILFALVAMLCALLGGASATPEDQGEGYGLEALATRVKRGYGHGGGGGGGHGHGPGKGGGAAGPVYFCGYVGKGEGYGGYGR